MSVGAKEQVDEPSHLAFLFGDPVAHSLSPVIHNAAFDALGLDAAYRAVRISPDDLPEAVSGLRSAGILGASVTIPHKEAATALVDNLTPRAKAIGAVNTIVVGEDGRLLGDNTDVAGFLTPLGSHMECLRGGSAVIFGAGGAARAVCYALLTSMEPSILTVVARRIDQAGRLIADLAAVDASGVLRSSLFDDARRAVRESRLVVNATPVGMEPAGDASPWPAPSDFHEGQVVYDLVYAPAHNDEQTRLLRDAANQGVVILGGTAMLIAQAAAAFKLWTGREMPMDAVREALNTTFQEAVEKRAPRNPASLRDGGRACRRIG